MKINFNKTIIILGVSTLTSIALADDQNFNNQYREAGMDARTPLTSEHFVWEAAMTDRKEIHLSELALQKSDNSDVKSFAKHIISDHKKACKKLQAIAEKEGLNFPDTNSTAMGMNGNDRWHTNHWNGNSNWNSNSLANGDTNGSVNASSAGIGHENYKGAEVLQLNNQTATNLDNEINLEAATGAEFDRAYAAKMVLGHEKAINKFEMAAANLQDTNLKKYAEKTLPTLRDHLRMAQDLQNKLGGSPGSGATNSYSGSAPMNTP